MYNLYTHTHTHIYIYIHTYRNVELKLYIYMGSYYENSLFTTIQNVIKYRILLFYFIISKYVFNFPFSILDSERSDKCIYFTMMLFYLLLL